MQESPEEVQGHTSTIQALRRSFLEETEGGGGAGGPTEWEKRLSNSPLRRHDDAPMIEPLEPEEVTLYLYASISTHLPVSIYPSLFTSISCHLFISII